MNIDSTGVETYHVPSFTFTAGATLPIDVRYRRYNTSASKTVLIPTCFGGGINTTLAFTTGALASYHVVVVAMLGNGESSSPSNTPKFPNDALDYRDQINAQYQLLTEQLHIKELEAVVGFSMGGQQAYYWAASHPEYIKRGVVAICGSAKTSDHNYAFLEGPRAALLNRNDYVSGTQGEHADAVSSDNSGAMRGVKAFGRAYLAWLYSQPWFRQKKWQDISKARTMAEFMDEKGDGLFQGWHPDDLLALSKQWQKGDLGVFDDKGDYRKALEKLVVKVLLMPARTDQYFPPEDSEEEMRWLKYGQLDVIESIWGHSAGGGIHQPDVEFMDEKIKGLLA